MFICLHCHYIQSARHGYPDLKKVPTFFKPRFLYCLFVVVLRSVIACTRRPSPIPHLLRFIVQHIQYNKVHKNKVGLSGVWVLLFN